MTALFFVCLIVMLFITVVMMESNEAGPLRWRGQGLMAWLAQGNWTAKLGGALLVIGVGALLRYILMRVAVAPSIKLAGGVAISALLFIAAQIIRRNTGRKEIAVALAGAGFGVAYLTAYSAYGFFHYFESSAGLFILGAVSVGAAAYAVLRRTLSIALLSMFGAFLAPAFALEQATPTMVYGYYLAISQMVLVMVAMRGWRALIHLSFLFTLAGGVFFAWTKNFYSPENFHAMRPLLLALIGVHLILPMVEQRSEATKWKARFDVGYFAALPLVGVILFASIAPNSIAIAHSLLMLSAIWLFAATALRVVKQSGGVRHATVGALLAVGALYVRAPHLPWLLIGQGAVTALLLFAPRLKLSRTHHDLLSGCMLMLSGLFVAQTVTSVVVGTPFANEVVIKRLVFGILLVGAWRGALRVTQPLAKFFGWLSAIVFTNTIAMELYRCDIASWPSIAHGVLVTGALLFSILAARKPIPRDWIALLTTAIVGTSALAVWNVDPGIAVAMLTLTPISLIALAFRSDAHESEVGSGDRVLAMLLAPVTAGIWATAFGESNPLFALTSAAITAIAVTSLAQFSKRRAGQSLAGHAIGFHIAFGTILFGSTLFNIRTELWSVLLDLACVTGLIQLVVLSEKLNRSSKFLFSITAIGAALAVQAMLLRVLGPGGQMTVFDVFDLQWPAVISLFWSVLGAVVTLVARRIGSRSLWTAGATMLVGCAVKLILFDFGSLGELTNILAVIAAGLMFLLVSWLSPLPPKDELEDTGEDQREATLNG